MPDNMNEFNNGHCMEIMPLVCLVCKFVCCIYVVENAKQLVTSHRKTQDIPCFNEDINSGMQKLLVLANILFIRNIRI